MGAWRLSQLGQPAGWGLQLGYAVLLLPAFSRRRLWFLSFWLARGVEHEAQEANQIRLTTTTVTSSAGSAPPVNAASALQIAPIVSSALAPRMAAITAHPVFAEHLALAFYRLGHALSVQDQGIAGCQVEPLLLHARHAIYMPRQPCQATGAPASMVTVTWQNL
jgi:hypothetical protein